MSGILDFMWIAVKDGDMRAYNLFTRHYSFYRYADNRRADPNNRNRHLFLGPGEKMVLITPEADALFAWRKFIDLSGQTGVCCAVFRNESPILSSELILFAEQLAWQRWPGERLYTYVNAVKVKSTNPGYCFLRARWSRCGMTGSGLVVMEKLP